MLRVTKKLANCVSYFVLGDISNNPTIGVATHHINVEALWLANENNGNNKPTEMMLLMCSQNVFILDRYLLNYNRLPSNLKSNLSYFTIN